MLCILENSLAVKKIYGPVQNEQGEKTKGGGQEMAVMVGQWQKLSK